MGDPYKFRYIAMVLLALLALWIVSSINWSGLISLIFYPIGSNQMGTPFWSITIWALAGLFFYLREDDDRNKNAVVWIFGLIVGIKILAWLISSMMIGQIPIFVWLAGALFAFISYMFVRYEEDIVRVGVPVVVFVAVILLAPFVTGTTSISSYQSEPRESSSDTENPNSQMAPIPIEESLQQQSENNQNTKKKKKEKDYGWIDWLVRNGF